MIAILNDPVAPFFFLSFRPRWLKIVLLFTNGNPDRQFTMLGPQDSYTSLTGHISATYDFVQPAGFIQAMELGFILENVAEQLQSSCLL